jgi:hypothetical protein
MQSLAPVAETNRKICVCVDPRVELISVIQTISHYRDILPFLLTNADSPYGRAVSERFADHSDHPAVVLFDELSGEPRLFNFMAPPTTMLYLRPDLTLRDDVLWPASLLARIKGREMLRAFARQLRDFWAVSAFAEFYGVQRDYYADLVAGVAAKLGDRDYVGELEAFYGTQQGSYTLILVSLYGHVGFGPLVDTLDGARHVYNILGPQRVQDGQPFFGDMGYFTMMQRHEFSHSFVNPLTDKYWDHVKDDAHLFDRLPEQKVCGEWQECINEYIIRAVTTFLAFEDGASEGAAALEAERARNVVLIDALLARVRDYAAQRDRYPTFDDYYPRLLGTFSDTLQPN